MGQQLLNVGAAVTTVSNDKKPSNEQLDMASKQDAKPFSSALKEQLEKKPDIKTKSEPVAKHHTPTDKNKVDDKPKAEDIDDESGNDLPLKESGEHSGEKIVLEDTSPELVILDATGDKAKSEQALLKEELTAPKVLETDSSELVDELELKATPTVANAATNSQRAQVTLPLQAQADKSNKHVATTQRPVVKEVTVLSADELDTGATTLDEHGSKPENKSLATPILRSDILNAIVKKTGDASQKSGSMETKAFQLTGEKQLELPLSDRQKMTKLLNSSASEALALRPANDKAPSGFSSALSLAGGAPSSSISSAPSQTSAVGQSVLTMQPSVTSEAWGKVLSSRVVWMAREGVQQAELRLNPARLGPVEVKLHMNNDASQTASVTFVAAHAATRDALEQALPRLRESFQENGMNLADANVSDQSPEQQAEDSENDGSTTAMTNQSSQNDNEDADEKERENQVIDENELEIGLSVRV